MTIGRGSAVSASQPHARHDWHTARMRQSVGTDKWPMILSRGGPTRSTRSSPFDCSLWIFLGCFSCISCSMVGCCWPGAGDCVRGLGERPPEPATRTVRRRRPRAVRLPTDPSVVTLARRAHAGTAVPQAPKALTGSPELPSLGDRGTLGRSGHATGGRWTAGGSTIDLVDNRSRSVLIMIIRTDGLPTRSVSIATRGRIGL